MLRNLHRIAWVVMASTISFCSFSMDVSPTQPTNVSADPLLQKSSQRRFAPFFAAVLPHIPSKKTDEECFQRRVFQTLDIPCVNQVVCAQRRAGALTLHDISETVRTVVSWQQPGVRAIQADNQTGRLIFAGASDGTVKIYSLNTKNPIRTYENHFGGVRKVTVDPTGNYFAVVNDSGASLCLMDMRQNRELGRIEFDKPDEKVSDAAFNPAFGANELAYTVSTASRFRLTQILDATDSKKPAVVSFAGEKPCFKPVVTYWPNTHFIVCGGSSGAKEPSSYIYNTKQKLGLARRKGGTIGMMAFDEKGETMLEEYRTGKNVQLLLIRKNEPKVLHTESYFFPAAIALNGKFGAHYLREEITIMPFTTEKMNEHKARICG